MAMLTLTNNHNPRSRVLGRGGKYGTRARMGDGKSGEKVGVLLAGNTYYCAGLYLKLPYS